MTISDKTRKILWGRSGNCCAICHCELVMASKHSADEESVIGDECHIVAREPNGPRGDNSLSEEARDSYSNLILLCKIHHKQIDDQPNAFTAAELHTIKTKHEAWVSDKLAVKSKTTSNHRANAFRAFRLETGQQLFQTLGGSLAFQFDNDELGNKGDIELVGNFLQNVQDCLDLWDELGSKDRLQMQFETSQDIHELLANGFLVYGCRRSERIRVGTTIDDWPVAYVIVLRRDNPLVAGRMEIREEVSTNTATPLASTDGYSSFILVSRS